MTPRADGQGPYALRSITLPRIYFLHRLVRPEQVASIAAAANLVLDKQDIATILGRK